MCIGSFYRWTEERRVASYTDALARRNAEILYRKTGKKKPRASLKRRRAGTSTFNLPQTALQKSRMLRWLAAGLKGVVTVLRVTPKTK